jgi:hypothetical protein
MGLQPRHLARRSGFAAELGEANFVEDLAAAWRRAGELLAQR